MWTKLSSRVSPRISETRCKHPSSCFAFLSTMSLKEFSLFFASFCSVNSSPWVRFVLDGALLPPARYTCVCVRTLSSFDPFILIVSSVVFFKTTDAEQMHNVLIDMMKNLVKMFNMQLAGLGKWWVAACDSKRVNKKCAVKIGKMEKMLKKGCWRGGGGGGVGRWLHIEDSALRCCCKAAEMKITARLQLWDDWGWKVSTQRACFGHRER